MPRDFDGSSGYLDHGNISKVNFTAHPLTIGCWIETDSVTGTLIVFGRCTTGTNPDGWGFGLSNDEVAFFRRGTTAIPTSTFNIAIGTRYFIAANPSGAININYWKIDTSGNVTTESTSGVAAQQGNPNACYTGRLQGGASQAYWNGKIAHLGIWIGDSLTTAELRAYAFGGRSAIGRIPDFYVPIWGIASPEPDYSSSPANGTVAGGAPGIEMKAPLNRYSPMAV